MCIELDDRRGQDIGHDSNRTSILALALGYSKLVNREENVNKFSDLQHIMRIFILRLFPRVQSCVSVCRSFSSNVASETKAQP